MGLVAGSAPWRGSPRLHRRWAQGGATDHRSVDQLAPSASSDQTVELVPQRSMNESHLLARLRVVPVVRALASCSSQLEQRNRLRRHRGRHQTRRMVFILPPRGGEVDHVFPELNVRLAPLLPPPPRELGDRCPQASGRRSRWISWERPSIRLRRLGVRSGVARGGMALLPWQSTEVEWIPG